MSQRTTRTVRGYGVSLLRGLTPPARLLFASFLFLVPAIAWAQPASLLPNPRLTTVTPPGGKAGSTVEVTFAGTDLEEPEALLFSQPGIKAEPVVPPPPPPDPKKKPAPKPAAAPAVTKFKVTIPEGTPVGFCDVRLVNRWGVSNPRVFVVGDLPEVMEKEPNDDVDKAQRVEINTTVNGVIASPTDVDYFVFAGKQGQRVVLSCLASSIDSRFRPGLALYDSAGKQLASNRNYSGSDALLDCTLPADGDYYVRLFEFTYTLANAEYFYRLSITTAPWIDAVFPPAVEPGKPAQLTVYGRNLPGGKPDPTAVWDGRVLEKLSVTVNVPEDPQAGQRLDYSGHLAPVMSGVDGFEYRIRNEAGSSNPFLLTYAKGPVVPANGANLSQDAAQEIKVPCEVAGTIRKRGERDWYAFTARQGEVYSIRLFSERIGAPTDLHLSLWNPKGKQQMAEMDDNAETLSPVKFYTRSNDPPRYRFVVPADGTYQVAVKNQNGAFGARVYYRLSITPERPDFRLIVMPPDDHTPDACRLLQGGHQFFSVFVWRQDGFNGNITLAAEDLPAGVTCPAQTLGASLRQTLLVLAADTKAKPGIYPFKVRGTAVIRGETVVREARPASITWPVAPNQNIPVIGRLDRSLVFAVREEAPYTLAATIDKASVVQGDKANVTLKLTRLWPDFKTPLQVQVVPLELPQQLTVNNNQPVTLAPGKDTATMVVNVNPTVVPGTYNIVLRGTGQLPFNKDKKAKQKPNVNIVQPSAPVTLTVLPKQVATVTVTNPNLTAKLGTQAEVTVRVARMYDFDGEFKVQVVLPPNVKGVTVADATIPAGKDEAKFMVAVAGNAPPGNYANLLVKAVAMVNGNVPTTQEAKLNLNVVK